MAWNPCVTPDIICQVSLIKFVGLVYVSMDTEGHGYPDRFRGPVLYRDQWIRKSMRKTEQEGPMWHFIQGSRISRCTSCLWSVDFQHQGMTVAFCTALRLHSVSSLSRQSGGHVELALMAVYVNIHSRNWLVVNCFIEQQIYHLLFMPGNSPEVKQVWAWLVLGWDTDWGSWPAAGRGASVANREPIQMAHSMICVDPNSPLQRWGHYTVKTVPSFGWHVKLSW